MQGPEMVNHLFDEELALQKWWIYVLVFAQQKWK